MIEFFEYTCDLCGKPLCERIGVMNLVLDQVDETNCLECLAQKENMSPQAFYDWILEYVKARDCFKTPWDKFNYAPCPRIEDKTCFCGPTETLDVRTTPCPLNFVKTRLALEKIPIGQILEVWIDPASESVLNIPQSIRAEGHEVVREEPNLWIRRLK
jgi:TusA-related sulfurtransferase